MIELVSRGTVTHWSIDGAPPPCGSFLDNRRRSWSLPYQEGQWPTCAKCALRDPWAEGPDKAETLLVLAQERGHAEAWPEVMPFGKHRGLRMDVLARVDPEYCRWLLQAAAGDAVLRSCVAWHLIDQGHPQVWLERTLRQLLAEDPFELTAANISPRFRGKKAVPA